ncbi:MAG: hypothetical protein DWQ06_13905 [Calditrichaeota bacterium]|nr:MAG: hypothetical protein DWQ06_13905 [Calditrichota bacterium]
MFRRLLLIVLFLAFNENSFAAGNGSVRSLGMGKTGVTHALGIDSYKNNPARLAASWVDLPIQVRFTSLSMVAGNNSMDIGTYNRYFFRDKGDYLTDTQKQDLLSSIESESMKFNFTTEATILAYAQNNFSIHIQGVGFGEGKVPRGVFEYALSGNVNIDDFSIDGTQAEGFGGAEIGFNYGFKLPKTKRMKIFTAGIGVRHFEGLRYFKVVEATGGIFTAKDVSVFDNTTNYYTSDYPFAEYKHQRNFKTFASVPSINPNNPNQVSRISVLTSEGGRTLVPIIDIGLYTEIKGAPRTSYGLTVLNVLGSNVKWNKKAEFKYTEFYTEPNYFDIDSDSVDVEVADSTIATGGFTSEYPSLVKFGIGKSWDNVTWTFEMEKGLTKNDISFFSAVRYSSGIEYRLWKQRIPLRFGIILRGVDGVATTWGTGINTRYFDFDFAYATHERLALDTKGISFGFSLTAKI